MSPDRFPLAAGRLFALLAALALAAPPALAGDPEVDADEYRVYADFLAAGRPADASAYPPDLGDIWRSGVVGRHTRARALDAGAMRVLHRDLGDVDPALVDDYRARNAVPASIPKRLQEHGVRVVADDAELPGVDPKTRSSLSFGTLQFSRVGFNPARDRALFHVYLIGGGPSLGWFVSMAKVDARWVLRKAALTDYIIH